MTGASISVIGLLAHQSTIASSDTVATRLDELQFELGEGPHWKALRTGAIVSIPDAHHAEHSEWPVFGSALQELDVGALFALPMLMGAVTIGVVDLYRSHPGAMSVGTLTVARALASATAAPALRRATEQAHAAPTNGPTEGPGIRREVHQATGMILIQLEISATDAFARLRAHAFMSGRSVHEVAHDVVARRLDFRQLPISNPTPEA